MDYDNDLLGKPEYEGEPPNLTLRIVALAILAGLACGYFFFRGAV